MTGRMNREGDSDSTTTAAVVGWTWYWHGLYTARDGHFGIFCPVSREPPHRHIVGLKLRRGSCDRFWG